MNLDCYAYLIFSLPLFIGLVRFALMIYPEALLPARMRVQKDDNYTPTVS